VHALRALFLRLYELAKVNVSFNFFGCVRPARPSHRRTLEQVMHSEPPPSALRTAAPHALRPAAYNLLVTPLALPALPFLSRSPTRTPPLRCATRHHDVPHNSRPTCTCVQVPPLAVVHATLFDDLFLVFPSANPRLAPASHLRTRSTTCDFFAHVATDISAWSASILLFLSLNFRS
jgi:hypothetical protein